MIPPTAADLTRALDAVTGTDPSTVPAKIEALAPLIAACKDPAVGTRLSYCFDGLLNAAALFVQVDPQQATALAASRAALLSAFNIGLATGLHVREG